MTCFRRLASVAVLFVCVGCGSAPSGQAAATELPRGPCTITGNPDWREAAQNWCDGQFFSHVNVGQDASNVVVMLQFTSGGQGRFSQNKFEVLNRLRRLADQMATKGDMNVAFSLHDAAGQFIGGCVRKRSDAESDCNAK